MRVLMVSKACVVGMYQRKLEELARCENLELVVAVPPFWRDGERRLELERQFVSGYQLHVLPMAFNGHFHLHFYPTLGQLLDRVQPDLLHMDEEPYNFATFHAMVLARRRRLCTLLFSWQNLHRNYAFPFGFFERYCLNHACCMIAGNQEAKTILRNKGFRRTLEVIPQFGVDPALYNKQSEQGKRDHVIIGYLGRMVREKGVQVLLHAVKDMPGDWRLRLVGSGEYLPVLQQLTAELGLQSRVEFLPHVASHEMPRLLNGLDVLVLPSLTQRNWKEQFGRVLIEAMACEVTVVGSSSGEIPHLIGEAGFVFPEGDAGALQEILLRLVTDAELRVRRGRLGRERVLEHFTQERVAAETCTVYARCLKEPV